MHKATVFLFLCALAYAFILIDELVWGVYVYLKCCSTYQHSDGQLYRGIIIEIIGKSTLVWDKHKVAS